MEFVVAFARCFIASRSLRCGICSKPPSYQQLHLETLVEIDKY